MAEILIRHYILAVIVFTMVIVGGVSMISDFAGDNDEFIDDDKFISFNRSFNKMEDLKTSVTSLETSTQTDPELGPFGFLDSLVKTVVNTLKTIFSSFGFIDDIFNSLDEVFGIPPWVGVLIVSMITVIISFSIFTVITQRET